MGLARDLKVSRLTIRGALALLQREGLIVTQQGHARSGLQRLLRLNAAALFPERTRAPDPRFALALQSAAAVSEICRQYVFVSVLSAACLGLIAWSLQRLWRVLIVGSAPARWSTSGPDVRGRELAGNGRLTVEH